MYNLYTSDDVVLDMLMINYLKQKEIEFIYRNNCIFLDDTNIKKINQTSDEGLLLHNYSHYDLESIYYNIIYRPSPRFEIINDFHDIYKKTEYLPTKRFTLPKNEMIFTDFIICDYFSFELISNPYSFILTLFNFIADTEEFSALSANYILSERNMILYFIFQFSSNEKTICFRKLNQFKAFILSNTDFLSNININQIPTIEQIWENTFLSNQPLFTENKMKPNHIGRNIFYPINSEVIL